MVLNSAFSAVTTFTDRFIGLVTIDGNSVSTLDDFNSLSSQIAQVTVTGVNAASYTPTNTAAQSCPTTGSDWQAATALPPTPNQGLCSCMYDALTCVPNDVSADSIGDLFGVVCGFNDGSCSGILANGTSGVYGAYSMCNSTEQLGWVLNTYYAKQKAAGNGASACDFSGSATTKAAVTPTGTCASLISQAGAAGTGSVTAQPSGTAKGHSGSGNGAAGFASTPSLNLGAVHVAGYALVAVLSGAGMILL